MKRNCQMVFILILFFTMGLSACSDDSDYVQPSSLVPLSIGNFWEYEYEDKSVKKDIITSKEVVEDQDVYFLETDYGTWTGKIAIYNTAQGYHETTYWDIDLNNSMYYYRYPVNVGDTWENTFRMFGFTHEYEVVSINELIEVPAGTFFCYSYKVQAKDNPESISYYYFSPGIGLIATKIVEVDSNGNSDKWIKKLYSYSLVE